MPVFTTQPNIMYNHWRKQKHINVIDKCLFLNMISKTAQAARLVPYTLVLLLLYK